MFDTLTLQDLYDLHQQLCTEHDSNHQRMMGPDGKTRMPVFSDEWAVLSAKQSEVNETAEAVYREIQTRYDEEASAGSRLLRDLRNQRGIDA